MVIRLKCWAVVMPYWLITGVRWILWQKMHCTNTDTAHKPTLIIQIKRKIDKRPRLIQCWLLWYYSKWQYTLQSNHILFSMPSKFNIQPFRLLFITFWIWLAMEGLNPNTNYAQILHTSNETWLYCNTLTLGWMPCAQCTVCFLPLAYKFNVLP